MTSELEIGLYIFMLAGFLGYHIITRVPPLLHTPLMSATNAIAAISLVGSLVVAGSDYSGVPNGWVCTMLGVVAVAAAVTALLYATKPADMAMGAYRHQHVAPEALRYAYILSAAMFVLG